MSLSCPLCGAELRVLDPTPTPDTAPYVCDADARAWWGSELTGEARLSFDLVTRTYASTLTADRVAEGIRDERAAARVKARAAGTA